MQTGYYVTLQRESREGMKTAWLLGPFTDHEKAKTAVREAAEKAEAIDPRCFWDARGASSITREGPLPLGVLNASLPHLLEASE